VQINQLLEVLEVQVVQLQMLISAQQPLVMEHQVQLVQQDILLVVAAVVVNLLILVLV
tara:strand:- start:189 stop:362 length:174 start_codon:yes stop_codon:yes gene_type:complete